MSQKILQYVEIDTDVCSLTYGVEPCQAKLEADPVSNTKLLMHLDFSAFMDASPAQHDQATVVGGVSISTAQYKFFGASALFNGTTGYLQYPTHTDWDFSGDFTIDCWINVNALAPVGSARAIVTRHSADVTNYWILYYNENGTVVFSQVIGGVQQPITIGSSANLVVGTWAHIALVRSGDTQRIYVNGVGGTPVATVINPAITGVLQIGVWADSNYFLSAYLDEFRISNVARWTANFTPPTAQYPAEDASLYNRLLLNGDGAQGGVIITDTSPGAHGDATIPIAGAMTVTSLKRFGDGSIYFPGTTSYLTFPDSDDWDFGAGDFTIDWWEYRFDTTAAAAIIRRDGATTAPQAFLLGHASAAGQQEVYMSSNGSGWDVWATAIGAIDVGAWTHWAVVRNLNQLYAFKNGVLTASTTSSLALFPSSGALTLGRWVNNLNACIDALRISKGVARWTSAFTPPTTADRSQTGTKKCFNTIATCQDRAHLTTSPVTLRFAVPTNYLPDNIECIPNIKSIAFDPAVISLGKDLGQRATLTVTFDDHRHSDTGAGFDKYYAERAYDPYSQGTFWGKFRARQPFMRGRPMRWIVGNTDQALADMETRHYIIDSFSGPDNNGAFKIIAKDMLKLADGDRALAPAVSQGYTVADMTAAQTTLTLSPTGAGADYPATGYVAIGGSEICSFSHQAIEGTDTDPYTKLLLHFEGPDGLPAAIDTSPANHGAGTVGGTTQIDTAFKKFGTSSMLFGTGGITFPNHADWEMGSADFTIEWWERRSAVTSGAPAISRDAAGINQAFLLGYSNGTQLTAYMTSAAGTWNIANALVIGAIELSVWHHWAITRSGSTFRSFRDGVLTNTWSSAAALLASSAALSVGNYAGTILPGNMDEIRISKGIARWTAAFTPPTAPYESGSTIASDVLTITRGQLNTVASTHSAQDRVQLCLRYSGVSPDLIIADLLQTYAAVESIYIPVDDWETEIHSHLNRLYTATIAQPTAVNILISELIEQAGLAMWWNDRDQEIGLMVLRGMVFTNYLFNEDNIILDSLQVNDQPDKRISQVHTYFGQINPLTSLTDKANYRSSSIISDAQSEADYGSPAIKEIFSRWIPQLGRSVADRLGGIQLARFKDAPRKIAFNSLRNSTTNEIILANGYQVQSWPLQDDTGEQELVNVQVTRMRPNPDIIEIETEEVLMTVVAAEDLSVRNIIVDANNYNLNLREAHDQIYPEPTAGIKIIITVNSGVKLGATAGATPSLTIVDWPVGITIIVHIIGRIQGKGGNGDQTAGTAVKNGGTAIYTRYPINLSCTGQLWGGGGGGGWGTTGAIVGGFGVGPAGSGGAGFDFGLGGAGFNTGPNGNPGTTEAGGASNGWGGAGGGPGAAGGAGYPGGGASTPGGAAGNAIDGLSFVSKGTWNAATGIFTVTGTVAGSILGPQIN